MGPIMFLDFLMLKFLDDPCPICKGKGSLTMESAVCPVTCDHCDGEGKKANLMASLAWCAMVISITILPLIWWFW